MVHSQTIYVVLGVEENGVWKKNELVFQLTAIWAFIEVTLGGLLHAVRIPLTGILVGGSAVMILSVLALQTRANWKVLFKSTLLVLLVKAGASPHSPPPAYIAVAFQGLAAAICFSLIRNFRVAVLLFAVIAMLESAIQKFLLMTIFYGSALWDAFDLFTESIAKSVGIDLGTDYSYATNFITLYICIYAIWGLFLGVWLGKIQSRIPKRINQWDSYTETSENTIVTERTFSRRKWKPVFWLVYLGLVVGMVIIFLLLGDGTDEIVYVVVRSVLAVLLVFGIINPLFRFWLVKKTKKSSNRLLLQQITDELEELRSDYKKALMVTQKPYWRLDRYLIAVEILIAKEFDEKTS